MEHEVETSSINLVHLGADGSGDSTQDVSESVEVEIGGLDKTLASALRREDAAHRTVLALSEEIVLLQSAMEIKQSEIRQYRLIGKLKDDKIQRLEEMIKNQTHSATGDDSEIQRLKSEVEFFKEKASKAPDATRYASALLCLCSTTSPIMLLCYNSRKHATQTRAINIEMEFGVRQS